MLAKNISWSVRGDQYRGVGFERERNKLGQLASRRIFSQDTDEFDRSVQTVQTLMRRSSSYFEIPQKSLKNARLCPVFSRQ